jgi:hypothetical protein
LWAASRASEPWLIAVLAVSFSYVTLTDYALLHEATHDNLHPDPRWNRILGRVVGALFPAPFTMVRTTHRGHHLRNRTDAEMFDLYYEHDNRFLKCVSGTGSDGVLLACAAGRAPREHVLRVLRSRIFHRAGHEAPPPALSGTKLRTIRLETAAAPRRVVLRRSTCAGQRARVLRVLAFQLVDTPVRRSRFTRRDVVNGARNFRYNKLMGCVLLHGEWDLNHTVIPGESPAPCPRPALPDEQQAIRGNTGASGSVRERRARPRRAPRGSPARRWDDLSADWRGRPSAVSMR